MGQVDDGLDRPFKEHRPDLVQQDSQHHGTELQGKDLANGDKERVPEDVLEIGLEKEPLEIVQAHPGGF